MPQTIGPLVNFVTKIEAGCLIELCSHFYRIVSVYNIYLKTDWGQSTQTSTQKPFNEEEQNILFLKGEDLYFFFSLFGFLNFVGQIQQIIVKVSRRITLWRVSVNWAMLKYAKF